MSAVQAVNADLDKIEALHVLDQRDARMTGDRSSRAAAQTSWLWTSESSFQWMDDAVCREDAGWFDLPPANTSARRRAVAWRQASCDDCPVLDRCAAHALVHIDKYGSERLPLDGFVAQVIAGEYVRPRSTSAAEIVERLKMRAARCAPSLAG
jgi:hypothetical protein